MKSWTACSVAVLAAAAVTVQATPMDVNEWPSVEKDHTKLQVVLPEHLMKQDGYPHKDALFGYPKYADGSLQAQLIYTNASGCEPLEASDWEPPFTMMLDRGECHFADKVRNAQIAGAQAVLIADNKCLCSDAECLRQTGDSVCETVLPYMSDDDSAEDITVPSMLIRKSDADAIKQEIAHAKGVSNVLVKFDWGVPSPDGRVEWTLWHSAWDGSSSQTLNELKKVVKELGDRAYFTPRFVSYNGTKVGCRSEDKPCGNMCLNNGRYCLLDPSPFHDRAAGASGADVVVENLRRKCIWKHVTEKDTAGVGLAWWNYVADSNEECGKDEQLFRERRCADQIMRRHKIDVKAVNQCMQPYGLDTDEENPLLEEELQEQTALQLLRLPALYVDGVHMRGRVDTSNILGMICAGYGDHDPPAVCSCAGQAMVGINDCVKAGSLAAAASFGGPGFSFVSLVVVFVGVAGCVATAGYVYYRRTQRQMREQVRSILSEYMPMEDQGLLDEDDLDAPGSPRVHPAQKAAAKSPRGYMPTRGFFDGSDDENGV